MSRASLASPAAAGGSSALYKLGADVNVTPAALAEVLSAPVAPGDYLVDARVLWQTSGTGTGSLRAGLGGTAAASSVVSLIEQWTAASGGGAQSFTVLSLNAPAGFSTTNLAQTLLFRITGLVTVTGAGTLGLVSQMSTGATLVGTVKAGTYFTLTKS